METKFTKGEWKVVNYGNCFGIEATLPNWQEHIVFTDKFCYASKFDGDAEANAKLIAAAPEMFEILVRVLADIERDTLTNNTKIMIEQAIKKATE